MLGGTGRAWPWGLKLNPYYSHMYMIWTSGWEVGYIPIFVGKRVVGIREMGTGPTFPFWINKTLLYNYTSILSSILAYNIYQLVLVLQRTMKQFYVMFRNCNRLTHNVSSRYPIHSPTLTYNFSVNYWFSVNLDVILWVGDIIEAGEWIRLDREPTYCIRAADAVSCNTHIKSYKDFYDV